MDSNNRTFHQKEIKKIDELAANDPQKKARLTAAGCALTKCYAEYPVDSEAYKTTKMLADLGASDAYQAERRQLKETGHFTYTTNGLFSDKNKDTVKQLNNTYQVTDRAIGAGQALFGGMGVAGAVVTAPAVCITGIGCVANVAVATMSVDAVYTGTKQLVSGQPEATLTNQALQGLGLSPEAAGYAEFALGVGAAAKVGSVVNAVTTAQANLNSAARQSYEDISKFGAKGLQVTRQVLDSPQAQKIASEYIAAGVSPIKALEYTADVLKTGKGLPTPITATQGTELIKLVPKNIIGGDAVTAVSPYFMTKDQYKALAKLPAAEIAKKLGLPAEQGIRGGQLGFDVYSMTPKTGVNPQIFRSEIAPVTQGTYSASGGAHQILVPNRSLWTDPNKITSIPGNTK